MEDSVRNMRKNTTKLMKNIKETLRLISAMEKHGGVKNSGTRSSLLFETIRIIKEMKDKPKWIIWENVKGVFDRNMRDSYFIYLKELEHLGYESKYEILNAMDFGIPQKRERIFVVSFLGANNF